VESFFTSFFECQKIFTKLCIDVTYESKYKNCKFKELLVFEMRKNRIEPKITHSQMKWLKPKEFYKYQSKICS